MLSAAVQRRLQAVVREELAFLARRPGATSFASTEQASACLLVHLVSVAAPAADGGASPSSGDEIDESVRVPRPRAASPRPPPAARPSIISPARAPPTPPV